MASLATVKIILPEILSNVTEYTESVEELRNNMALANTNKTIPFELAGAQIGKSSDEFNVFIKEVNKFQDKLSDNKELAREVSRKITQPQPPLKQDIIPPGGMMGGK